MMIVMRVSVAAEPMPERLMPGAGGMSVFRFMFSVSIKEIIMWSIIIIQIIIEVCNCIGSSYLSQ